MRIIFMGTPDFAVPCLDSVVKDGHEVCAVFTNPDKPKGRGYEMSISPVKKKAIEYDLPLMQPKSLKDDLVTAEISKLNPDVIVVVAYGKILPKSILSIPKHGCINVHGSLLPKYRGAAPIQWAVINGEEITGVTTMFMDEGLDTGDIILKRETKINPDETSFDLFNRLCVLGAELLCETLNLIRLGKAVRTKQDQSNATYAKMLDKSMSNIDWSKDAKTINNLVRGLYSWPCASTVVNGKKLKIYKTRLLNEHSPTKNFGTIKSFDPVIVVCGDGQMIEICDVQYEGKKRMSAADFFRGQKIKPEKLV